MKLFIINPAPTSSVMASATSPITSRLRNRCFLKLPAPRAPSFITDIRSVFDACQLGAIPHNIAVAVVAPSVNASTRQSIENFIQGGSRSEEHTSELQSLRHL